MQRLRAGIAGSRPDGSRDITARRHEIGLELLIVAVLVVGVADDRRAHIGMVAIEARRAAADPAGSLR